MEQQQQNKEYSNPQFKEILKQILLQKDGDDDQQESDKSINNRSNRSASYSYQTKTQAVFSKGRKNTLDQITNRETSGNGSINQSQLKQTKQSSIPLSQIIQNIELQNQLNLSQTQNKYSIRESISLSQEQFAEISNYLKILINQQRIPKIKSLESNQNEQQQASLRQKDNFEQLSQSLRIEQQNQILIQKDSNKQIKIQNSRRSSNEVVEILEQFSKVKQQANICMNQEDYKALTLICIQQQFVELKQQYNKYIQQNNRCNLRDWTDFLLQDMQSNNIQPDRLILDEYMRLVANNQ